MVYLKCVSCNGKLVKIEFQEKYTKHVFCALSLNISYKIHFFFEDKFLVVLDTYAKKNKPTLDRFFGGVHGKACWLIAYYTVLCKL